MVFVERKEVMSRDMESRWHFVKRGPPCKMNIRNPQLFLTLSVSLCFSACLSHPLSSTSVCRHLFWDRLFSINSLASSLKFVTSF